VCCCHDSSPFRRLPALRSPKSDSADRQGVDPQFFVRQPQGQSQELCNIEDRGFRDGPAGLRRIGLTQIEIHLAQRAGDRNALGPRLAGHGKQPVAQPSDHAGVRHGKARPAALGLERPVDRLRPGCGDQIVHGVRMLCVVERDDLRRPGQEAAVIAGHAEPCQPPADLRTDRVQAEVIHERRARAALRRRVVRLTGSAFACSRSFGMLRTL
jgi:hypothetical protein